MKTLFFPLLFAVALVLTTGTAMAQRTGATASSGPGRSSTTTSAAGSPSQIDMANGLKEALQVGVGNAVSILGKQGGYLQDPKVHIPFPKDAQFAADKLRQVGAGALVDEFEKLLNQGAEDGAKMALPIFKSALQQMTISDAAGILLSGNKRGATDFFEKVARQQLYTAFAPHMKSSLDRVNATKYWGDLTGRYNSVPFVKRKVQTDIVKYATNKAPDGLFLKIAEEEAKIRLNPMQQGSALLQAIFGFALGKK